MRGKAEEKAEKKCYLSSAPGNKTKIDRVRSDSFAALSFAAEDLPRIPIDHLAEGPRLDPAADRTGPHTGPTMNGDPVMPAMVDIFEVAHGSG